MRSIAPQLTAAIQAHVGKATVAKAEPLTVRSYQQLMEHVAHLAHANKDHLLFFRGQDQDYLNKAASSTIYPSIYRGELLTTAQLELRMDVLKSAAKRLCDALQANGITGHAEVQRRRYIQWSILQHYEVCPTPLLDLTHGVRVACSFAFLSQARSDPLVLVFALPYSTNRVSINSEYDLVMVRLLSICPPQALRPYFQDGYMAGTDEEVSGYASKDELDFSRVLVAKFRFRRLKTFWGSGFSALPKRALYPPNDTVARICKSLRAELGTDVDPGRLGQFLQAWTDLEGRLMSAARQRRDKVYSLREALAVLRRSEAISPKLLGAIDGLRQTRNRVVHYPREVSPQDLVRARTETEALLGTLAKGGIRSDPTM